MVNVTTKYSLHSDLNTKSPKTKPLVYDIESIYQSIINILNTPIGSRMFNRDFGCDLQSINFELLDFVTVELATYTIFNAISNFEPRVRISNKSVITPDIANHKLDIYLVFEVLGLSGQNYTLNISLER